MADWLWALAIPPTAPAIGPVVPGGLFGTLATARGRKLTVRVDATQPDEATFTINGKSDEASQAQELTTDVAVLRNQQCLFRGRILPTADSLVPGRHDTAVTAKSVREILFHRTMMNDATLSWTTTDQGAIVWAMVSYAQGQPGGNLGLTQGLGAVTGITRTYTVTKADYIGQKIAELAGMDSGFDWDVTPYSLSDLRLDIFYPAMGANRGVVLEWGGDLMASVQRNVDPSIYANADYVTGDPAAALTDVIVADSGIGTAAQGRWEAAVGTTIKTQTALQSRANWLLGAGEVITPSYQVVLRSGAWQGPQHIWKGDTVRLRVNSGRLNVDTDIRVMQMDIEPGDSGEERVTLTLGALTLTVGQRIALMERRIQSLQAR